MRSVPAGASSTTASEPQTSPEKEAARQSATDAGPQAFYDELALSSSEAVGGTSSESQANPGGQITNPPRLTTG